MVSGIPCRKDGHFFPSQDQRKSISRLFCRQNENYWSLSPPYMPASQGPAALMLGLALQSRQNALPIA
jgi:hypothetical protein